MQNLLKPVLRCPARCRALGFTALAALGPAAATYAQPVADAKDNNDWLAAIAAVFLVVLLALGSFVGSRRGHQD